MAGLVALFARWGQAFGIEKLESALGGWQLVTNNLNGRT